MSRKAIDITGQRFGRLTVLRRVEGKSKGHTSWLCVCDCGNKVVAYGENIRYGRTQSCGGLHKEVIKKCNSTHGETNTRLFHIWSNMKARCSNKNLGSWKNYGGRGISVCSDWMRFEAFRDWALLNGYDENLTIDRIDVNGNYEPKNCRWTTMKEQARNKRNNVVYKGKCLSEWAEEMGIGLKTLSRRLRSGWSIEKTIFTPVRNH